MTSFRRLAIASTLTTIVLVAIGGLVRASGSGLGCGNSWPDCSGHLIPSVTNAHVMIEFSHRIVATAVVILIGALAVSAIRNLRDRPGLLWPAMAAFGLVLFQAVLGAIVVKVDLGAVAVVLHLATAMALVALLIYITAVSFALDDVHRPRPDASFSRHAGLTAACVLVLLLVGSYVSGRGAGNVFPDWPLMNGKVVPDLSVALFAIHFLHRVLAAIVGVLVAILAVRVIRRKREFPVQARLAHAALGLFALEILIGAGNVWTNLNSAFVTAHLLTGALIWASVAGIAIVSHPALSSVGAERPARARRAVAEAGG